MERPPSKRPLECRRRRLRPRRRTKQRSGLSSSRRPALHPHHRVVRLRARSPRARPWSRPSWHCRLRHRSLRRAPTLTVGAWRVARRCAMPGRISASCCGSLLGARGLAPHRQRSARRCRWARTRSSSRGRDVGRSLASRTTTRGCVWKLSPAPGARLLWAGEAPHCGSRRSPLVLRHLRVAPLGAAMRPAS